MPINHENVPRYRVVFPSLSIDELHELMTLVAREAGGNTFDQAEIEAVTR